MRGRLAIALPSLKHSHTADFEVDEKYNITVQQLDNVQEPNEESKKPKSKSKNKEDSKEEAKEEPKETKAPAKESPNYSKEHVAELEEIQIETIIKRNLSYVLMEHERDSKDKKEALDISELPQMISGQVTRMLTELEEKKTREYGWHFIVTSPFQPKSESLHLNTSVAHYYDLSKEDQAAGIHDVIYREYLIDFLLPPKMSSMQIHILAYRLKRGLDTAVGKLLESVKSFSITSLLSIGAMHKIFFLTLVILYFANRFV